MGLPRVVIIGSGFGGIRVARKLKNAKVKLTIVDCKNHHLFQPLLYQVASSALDSKDIAFPIREILKNQKNTTVILDEATYVLPDEHSVLFASGRRLEYDYLILAVGSRHSYFGHSEWEKFAPGLKTLEDGIRIRSKILSAFEFAEGSDSKKEAEKLMTFVVIGGGPTGVELAGAIGEIAQKTMFKNFRYIDPSQTMVYLIEAGEYILPSYPKELSLKAEKDLTKIGVTVLTNSPVNHIDSTGVQIGDKKICTPNIFWAAGNMAPKLLASLGTPLDKCNRAIVNTDLSIPDYPEVFVIGDAAYIEDESGDPLPGIAPVAIQQGQYVGNLIVKQLKPEKRPPFKYRDKGSMATIGKARAVALVAGMQFTGFTAWLLWVFIHIAYLVGFRHRVIVMLEWLFSYITEKRSSRIIYDAFNNPVSNPEEEIPQEEPLSRS